MPRFLPLFALACCALRAVPSPAQTAGYKTVMADEFVRGFFATQRLAQTSGTTGGVFSAPSSLSGTDIDQRFVNLAGQYDFPWYHWDIGDVQPVIRAVLGGTWYDGTAPAPMPGGTPDDTAGLAFSLSLGGGVHWRPWRHTTVSASLSYGYLYSENNYTYNTAASQALAPQFDGSSRNWFAHALTGNTTVGVEQSLPLGPGAWEESEDAPRSPRLRLASQFASITVLGFYGDTNDQQRYVTAYAWTNGIELFLPLGALGERHLFLAPFVQRTDMMGDGRRSLAGNKHFYQAGVRAEFFNDTGWAGNDTFYLTGAALWGEGFNGWQVGAGLQF